MAAILEPRSHHRTRPVPARPGGRPLITSAEHRPSRLATVAAPPEPLLTTRVVAAMVATVVVAALFAVGIGAGAFSGLVPEPGTATVAAAESTVVVVEPGDSLWSIARRVQPEGDVRPLVHRIVQVNGSRLLQPGQEIVVPN